MSDASVQREDVYRQTVDAARFGVVAKPLSAWERIYNLGAVRKCLLLVALAVAWEVYARWLDNALLFPTFGATVEAFYDGMVHGELLDRAWTSIRILLVGYFAGIALAGLLTVVAITSRIGTDPHASGRGAPLRGVWAYRTGCAGAALVCGAVVRRRLVHRCRDRAARRDRSRAGRALLPPDRRDSAAMHVR